MSDVAYQWIIPQLIGAVLAIIGGFSADITRLRLERRQEIDYIKTGLTDELHEICTIIDKMAETHNVARIIPPSYFNDLDENRESFDQHKPKLFLISDAVVRKAISDFYRKLSTEIKKSRDTVGTLKEGDPQDDVTTGVTTIFTNIKADAVTLKGIIKGYNFKPFYFF